MKKLACSVLSTLLLSVGFWPLATLSSHSAHRLEAFATNPEVSRRIDSDLPQTLPMLLAGRFNRRYRFGVRASRYRRGGFSRGDCPSTESFMPLVPDMATRPEADNNAAITLSQNSLVPTYPSAAPHPVFFVNLPALPATQGTLFIDNANPAVSRNQRQLYKVAFETSGEPGVVGIRIPSNAPALVPGETYLWRLSVACTPDSVSNIVLFRGGVITQVAEAPGTPDEQLDIYLEQEIWQNLLTTVAEARYQNPNDTEAETNWREFIESSGLEALVDTPIVEFIDARYAQ